MRLGPALAVPLLTLGCASGGGLSAQSTPAPGRLDELEEAVDQGRIEGVRQALDAWLADAGGAPPAERGRARYLRARLMTSADSARDEFLAVALDARSPYGARAWIRLAQLDLARGEPARAVESLERLRADYPGNAVIPSSWFWSARAQEAAGDLTAACAAFDRAVLEAREAGDSELLERAVSASRACAPGGLTFTLQLGAFSRRSAAESMAEELRRAGFDARVVSEEGLEKVRVGRFATAEAARALERRLRDAGYSVAVVAGEP